MRCCATSNCRLTHPGEQRFLVTELRPAEDVGDPLFVEL
jgi:hypothetical protein